MLLERGEQRLPQTFGTAVLAIEHARQRSTREVLRRCLPDLPVIETLPTHLHTGLLPQLEDRTRADLVGPYHSSVDKPASKAATSSATNAGSSRSSSLWFLGAGVDAAFGFCW